MREPGGILTRAYQPDPRLVDRAVDAIVRAYDPLRVIVFGSFARGDTHEDSDLDLIVVKETEERFFRRIGRVRDACPDLGIDVQPLVYTPAELGEMLASGNSFLETALAEGVVAYEAPTGSTPENPTGPLAVRQAHRERNTKSARPEPVEGRGSSSSAPY
jgi:predicted nucleotidyltransferase